eukprot:scaffold876_cov99-Isochrysis_galbana.AAC.1
MDVASIGRIWKRWSAAAATIASRQASSATGPRICASRGTPGSPAKASRNAASCPLGAGMRSSESPPNELDGPAPWGARRKCCSCPKPRLSVPLSLERALGRPLGPSSAQPPPCTRSLSMLARAMCQRRATASSNRCSKNRLGLPK